MSKRSDDTISRQDAINALGEEPEIWNDTEEEWAYRNAWVEHISAIKSLPSADRPTGEWVEEDEYGDLWVCDQCGFASEYKDNYCPNCGCLMKKGD